MGRLHGVGVVLLGMAALASPAGAEEELFVFSGPVTFVSEPAGLEVGVEIGETVGYAFIIDFERAATADSVIVEAANLGTGFLPPALGGFRVDLIRGTLRGPAESICAGQLTLDEPTVAESNLGVRDFGFLIGGYGNDFILIEGPQLTPPPGPTFVDPDNWDASTVLSGTERLCDFEGQGPVTIFSDLRLTFRSAADAAALSVSGRITDSATGGRVACATVVAAVGGAVKAAATTDRNGDYFLRDLWPGDYDLRVIAPGYRSATERVDGLADLDNLERILDFTLTPDPAQPRVFGRVLDADNGGTPLAGAVVTLTGGGAMLGETYTCASGRFEFTDVPGVKGGLNIRAGAQGYTMAEQAIEPDTETDIGLMKSIVPNVLSGIVTDDGTGGGIPGVEVAVQGRASLVTHVLETNAAGLYNLVNVANGEYTVRASAPGFVAQEKTSEVKSSNAVVDFALDSGETPPPGTATTGCMGSGPASQTSENTGDLALLAVVFGTLVWAQRRGLGP